VLHINLVHLCHNAWVESNEAEYLPWQQHLSESGLILFTVTGLDSLRVLEYGMDSLNSWHPVPNFSNNHKNRKFLGQLSLTMFSRKNMCRWIGYLVLCLTL
jgi:hypothetical protein